MSRPTAQNALTPAVRLRAGQFSFSLPMPTQIEIGILGIFSVPWVVKIANSVGQEWMSGAFQVCVGAWLISNLRNNKIDLATVAFVVGSLVLIIMGSIDIYRTRTAKIDREKTDKNKSAS